MSFVYILQSEVNERYYIGSTSDIKRRLSEHNSGKSSYTRLTKPYKLVFVKKYPTLKEAKQVEYKLKKFKSRKIIEQIIVDKNIKIN